MEIDWINTRFKESKRILDSDWQAYESKLRGERLKLFISLVSRKALIAFLAATSSGILISMGALIFSISSEPLQIKDLLFNMLFPFFLAFDFLGPGFLVIALVLSLPVELLLFKGIHKMHLINRVVTLILIYGLGSILILNISRIIIWGSEWEWLYPTDLITGEFYLLVLWLYNKYRNNSLYDDEN
ncbi:hypothetical protein [Cohnella zeiphila]|uniref:Uncharacterized protein n=1 Tax=Cohnella zeiphila TaxID=2761120 RepID=A0A7X0VWU3_9BACL|nr:hypothetical protein [Cohnella zeiphila]MBB6733599.1 hypothetical protein [Cohnella zeiphila]